MDKYKNDITIILIMILIALFVYCGYSRFSNQNRTEGDYVEINVNGSSYGSYSVFSDTIIPVRTEFGYNLIEIKDGRVCVSEADCHDELCVNRGKISENGQQIVCLPNRLTVKINKSESTGGYDAVAY